jgi:hypothetical protein
MATDMHWKNQFDLEIARSERARAEGNEGMARVCARRAAGIVAGEYLQRRGKPLSTPSAYDRLRYLSDLPGASPQVVTAASHLLTRVTLDFTLPVEADLIADARSLRQELLAE